MRRHRSRSIQMLVDGDGSDDDVVSVSNMEVEDSRSRSDELQLPNPQELTEKRFPFFVPSNSAWSKKPKRSWKPLSGSSKRILLQYARRAKRYMDLREYYCSSILGTIPEPRRDDVIHLLDRIIKSSTRKLDVGEHEWSNL